MTVAAKMSVNVWIASIFWASKQVKGTDDVVLVRALVRRLAASVAVSTENTAGMAPLWSKNILFLMCSLPVSLSHRCGIIASGVVPFQCTNIPFHGSLKFASAVASQG